MTTCDNPIPKRTGCFLYCPYSSNTLLGLYHFTLEDYDMHILPLEVSNEDTREKINEKRMALVFIFLCLRLYRYLQQFIGFCGNIAHMHKWYGWWGTWPGQSTETMKSAGWTICANKSQLCTVSFCSVSEACWATVLFSWLRNLDTTSRNARLWTSLWRGSEKISMQTSEVWNMTGSERQ